MLVIDPPFFVACKGPTPEFARAQIKTAEAGAENFFGFDF